MGLTVRVPEEQLAQHATEGEKAAEFLSTFVIEDDAQALTVAGLLHAAKERWQRLEEERTAITAPMNEALRGVNRLFKSAQDPFVRTEKLAKERIADYQRSVRAGQEQAMLAAAAGDSTALARTSPGAVLPGILARDEWAVEVLDADQVPRCFCSPDMAKLRSSRDWSAYSEQHPPPPIAGVRFIRRTRVTART